MKANFLYKNGGAETAARFYNKGDKSGIISLTIERQNSCITHDLTVSEAEKIACELLDLVDQIKAVARELKGESA